MKEKITNILKECYGENAKFRNGQYEAIISAYSNPRTLVVQKTGWGKSLVYFITTKLFRSEGKGVTFVVSPLLALMDNQKEAANKLGLKSICLNSNVDKNDRPIIISNIKNNIYDLVFITPENLFKDDVQNALPNIKIGLFVIDEAHCISDWGHDFRLEYGKLNKILLKLPSNVHVLGTTATANNRVVADLQKQFGEDVNIFRGDLTRESLSINIVSIKNSAERYAWILKNINKLPGSGIIYCLTHRDCEYLATFLNNNGISAVSYFSKSGLEEQNREALNKFFKNEVKVIVATIKLGMGFDKGDIGFVIHYQMPSNIVSFYQQIGRAGRKIEKAYSILMSGPEDLDIIDYFINTAFPSEYECTSILDCLENFNGLSVPYICKNLNFKQNRVKKTISFLENEGYIYKEGTKYYASAKNFNYDRKHYDEITEIRVKERNQMVELLSTDQCLNKFIVNALDDSANSNCDRCSNCSDCDLFDNNITDKELENALYFINSLEMTIEPRKRWPFKDIFGELNISNQLLPGICLSKYGDIGYGKLVSNGKYKDKYFSDELIDKSASVLKKVISQHSIKYITNVPSLRSDIVKEFTIKLANKLQIEYVDVLEKKNAKQQKEMNNSYHQCLNAVNSFSSKDHNYSGNIILVDDIIDSGWTLTVCGHYLSESGFGKVFPYALADSSNREEENE